MVGPQPPSHLSPPLLFGLLVFSRRGCFLGRAYLRYIDSVLVDEKKGSDGRIAATTDQRNNLLEIRILIRVQTIWGAILKTIGVGNTELGFRGGQPPGGTISRPLCGPYGLQQNIYTPLVPKVLAIRK